MGEKGGLCEWYDEEEISKEAIEEIAWKLRKLKNWCDHFRLRTRLPKIIEWMLSGPHSESMVFGLGVPKKEGFFA